MESKQKNKKTLSKKFLKKQLLKSCLELERMTILKNDFAHAQRNEVLKNNDLVDRINLDSISINRLEKYITLQKNEIDFLHKQVLIGLEMLEKSIDNTNELKAQNKELVKRLLTFTDDKLTDDQRMDDQLTDFVSECQNGCDCNFIENGCKANSL